MGYYEIKIYVDEADKDLLIAMLEDTLGIIDEVNSLICYYNDTVGIDRLKAMLNSLKLDSKGLKYEYSYISERDWNEGWKKRFVPIDIEDTEFTIVPPWLKTSGSRINITIDPGMAFGTGHHETTRNCIRLINRYSELVNKGSFIDLGTGTGVLAICASRLGFKEVCAVDNDPLAIDASSRNISENGIENIKLIHGDVSIVNGQFDMVVANLLLNVLLDNCKLISSILRPSGIALISGLIAGQEMELLPCLLESGLETIEVIQDGRWLSLVMTKLNKEVKEG